METRIRSVVVVFFNGSFMKGTNGSHTRAAESIAYFVRTFEQVVLYSFSDHPVDPWDSNAIEAFRKRYPTVRLVTERGQRAFFFTRLKNLAIALLPVSAKILLRMRIPRITPLYHELLRELPANAVFFVNFVDGLSQLNGIPASNVVVDTHDVKFIKHCKVKRQALNSVKALLRLRSEIAMLNVARAVIGISTPETAFFKLVFPRDTFYLPTFGEGDSTARRCREPQRYEYDLLFVASENMFNVQGFVQFVCQFSQWLQTRRVAVAGSICNTKEIRELARGNKITLLGFVENLAKVYQITKACLSPIDGTGLKIKVVEALRHGRPVFASRHAIDGLPQGHQDCVFPINASNMETLLDNAERLRMAQESALRYSSLLDSYSEVGAFTSLCRRIADVSLTMACGEYEHARS